jgi:hypothetical protein
MFLVSHLAGVIPAPKSVVQGLMEFIAMGDGVFLKWYVFIMIITCYFYFRSFIFIWCVLLFICFICFYWTKIILLILHVHLPRVCFLLIARYPHLSGGEPLREALCKYCDCINESLMVTNGSDDALILICQTYLKHDAIGKKHVLTPTPTYEHFCVNALGMDGIDSRMRWLK